MLSDFGYSTATFTDSSVPVPKRFVIRPPDRFEQFKKPLQQPALAADAGLVYAPAYDLVRLGTSIYTKLRALYSKNAALVARTPNLRRVAAHMILATNYLFNPPIQAATLEAEMEKPRSQSSLPVNFVWLSATVDSASHTSIYSLILKCTSANSVIISTDLAKQQLRAVGSNEMCSDMTLRPLLAPNKRHMPEQQTRVQ